jgi:hypothetical protein
MNAPDMHTEALLTRLWHWAEATGSLEVLDLIDEYQERYIRTDEREDNDRED